MNDRPATNPGGGARASASLPIQEVVDLFSESLALFDGAGELSAFNDAFRQVYSGIEGFIVPGTAWSIFLLEIENHGLLPAEACTRLRLIEEELLDGPAAPKPYEARNATGDAWLFRLVPTSDGGFAFTQSRTVDNEGRAESDRQAEQLMSKVLEACPANLTMSRVGDGQILYRTPAAMELLGIGRNSREHFARREERADFVTALLPDARVDDMRIVGRRADGSEFPASLSARLIEYRDEEVIVANVADLTEEIEIQAELARQKDLNFQSEKMSALGELLAGVAHELNNPLSVIVGNAEMLREEDLNGSAMRRVEKVSDASERCVKIVRTFLSMAREQPLDLSDVAVSDLIGSALDAYDSLTDASAVTVDTDIPEGLPDLAVDEVQIIQILINLVMNAAHAIEESGVGDRIVVSARTDRAGSAIRISVADNGPGVPEDIHGRIFDPLFTTKGPGKGTGVGLAFCHRVMMSHGGMIELDRSRKNGATFVLSFKAS